MNPLMNNGNMFQQFQQFKKMMQGKDPQKVLNELVSSGKYSQQQVEQAKRMAEQFKSFLKQFRICKFTQTERRTQVWKICLFLTLLQ